jgi:hypothetical protein
VCRTSLKVNSHYGKNYLKKMERLPVFDGRELALDETAEVNEEDVTYEQEHEANVAVPIR